MLDQSLKVMVLAGGPDRERPVSLVSGEQVAAALQQRGHDVRLRDILPDNLAALDEFVAWGGPSGGGGGGGGGGDVIFPAMHGSWGEGGGLQRILTARGLPYVGCGPAAADLCIDKHRTKQVLESRGLPTPAYEVIGPGDALTLAPPLVIKPLREGSSIDVAICRDAARAAAAKAELSAKHPRLLVERFIAGIEMTVGVIGRIDGGGNEALPPVQIVPATEFYDYQAKYLRDDTQYVFDIPLPAAVLALVREQALAAFRVLGCRHLSRVDFIVDEQHQPWILEINTIPGFTTHSLVPKAAAQAGIAWGELVERLVRLPLAERAVAAR